MSDEEGQEKTEQPTERKLEQAREKGQVPRSHEVASAGLLIFGGFGLLIFGGMLCETIAHVFELCLKIDREAIFDAPSEVQVLLACLREIAIALLPLLISLYVIALGASVATGGWNFSSEAMMPKLDKLNPINGLKRMFSVKSLVELLKSILKFILVTLTAIAIVKSQQEEYLQLAEEPIRQAIIHGAKLVGWAFVYISMSLILVVAIDVPYQMWSYTEQLKMTKQEIKEEYKDTEGKPEIKGKQRQRAREIAMAGMMGQVPKADVVITNPTHYAVALKYDPSKPGAPRLVAKGADLMAEQIKRVALANNVTILSSPPLARSIFYNTKLKREIPPGLYVAVAQVLAYVYHLKRFRAGQGPNPGGTPAVDVPPELRRD